MRPGNICFINWRIEPSDRSRNATAAECLLRVHQRAILDWRAVKRRRPAGSLSRRASRSPRARQWIRSKARRRARPRRREPKSRNAIFVDEDAVGSALRRLIGGESAAARSRAFIGSCGSSHIASSVVLEHLAHASSPVDRLSVVARRTRAPLAGQRADQMPSGE